MHTRLIFVRHGHSEANSEGVWGGHGDYDLTQTGVKQARIMADYVLKNYRIDAVVASDLKRAVKTAQAVASELNLRVEQDSRLRELCGGIWEGMSFEHIAKYYPKEFELWKNDMSKVTMPEGETVFDLQKRAKEALADICEKHQGENVLIVTHRVLLRTIQCIWNNISLHEINKCEWLTNCSVSEVIYDNGSIIPVNVAQDSFMGNDKTNACGVM